MKYFVIENKDDELNELFYDIADFFWNSGNSVYISGYYNTELDCWNSVKQCDCIILFRPGDCSSETFCEHNLQKLFHNHFHLDVIRKKSKLIFLSTGVYFTDIPFPHKIYHYDSFSKCELVRFFHWSRKLNLFQKCNN